MSSSVSPNTNDDPPVNKNQSTNVVDTPITPDSIMNSKETIDPLEASFIEDPGDEDYFTDPLVVNTQSILGTDEITGMVQKLAGTPSPDSTPAFATYSDNPVTAELLGLKKETETGVTSTGNPYMYNGKLVKFARFYIANVEIPQNSGWSGYQDYIEDGAILGFTVTCNDPDMIPVCFVENASNSRDVINDLSYKESVQHGRGMTYGEATTTYRTSEGVTSRDVSGRDSSLFPYIARYKDQFTGTGIYDDIKNTIDDKCYVMTYEPSIPVPYTRLYFDVYNGSSIGSKLVNRLEIKRLVYVNPDAQVDTITKGSDFTQFQSDLTALSNKMNSITSSPIVPPPQQPPVTTASLGRETFMDKLKDDFIRYMYKKNQTEPVKVDLSGKSLRVADMREQQNVNDMFKTLNGVNKKQKKVITPTQNDDVLVVKFE